MLLQKRATTSERSLICPVCGRQCASPSGYSSHIRTCKDAPPRDELEGLCEDRWTIHDMQVKYGTSGSTVARWLKNYGLETWGQGDKGRAEDNLVVYPGYAPKLGKWLMCAEPPGPDYDGTPVPVCHAYWFCLEEALKGKPTLCEAPDHKQMSWLERQGYDLLQERTELWLKHPEFWTE